MSKEIRRRIFVAAGTNGAGKSSIIQPFMREHVSRYFNPDEYARKLVAAGMPLSEANEFAWSYGFKRLQGAVDEGYDYAFETTLGGNSVPAELMRALAMGCRLEIFYVGLASAELHIQRVSERVRRGGHHIDEAKIRQRYQSSLKNLSWFIGTPARIRVWDNSEQSADGRPKPFEVFRIEDGGFVFATEPAQVPNWTKSLILRAQKFYNF